MLSYNKDLYIVGNGPHSKVVHNQFVKESGAFFKGFLSASLYNAKLLVNDKQEFSYPSKNDTVFLLGTASRFWLNIMVSYLEEYYDKDNFPNWVSPLAYVSDKADLGYGNVILPFAYIDYDTKIGNYNLINTYASVHHHSVIGNTNILSPYAAIMGNCKVGDNNYLGVSTKITHNRTIVDSNVLSSGEVLFDDMSDLQFFKSGIVTDDDSFF
jgi:hypothetical protein